MNHSPETRMPRQADRLGIVQNRKQHGKEDHQGTQNPDGSSIINQDPVSCQENLKQNINNACLDFNKAPKQKTGGGHRFQQDRDLIGAAQAACERGWRYGDE